MLTEKLKTLQVDRMSVEEGVELLAMAQVLASGYGSVGLPQPAWLTASMKTLAEDLQRRKKDTLEAELQRIKARRTALRSREEEREALIAEEQAILAQLGQAPAAQTNG